MTISYFEDIEKHIMSRLNSSQSSIFVAVAWFTNQLLFDSLMDALKKNIAVKILILDDILNMNEFGLDFGILTKLGADVRFAKKDFGTMHNKFCIIDNLVITGSYNWTYHANNNSENILMTDEESVVISYGEEFEKLFNAATPIPQPYERLKWTDVKEGDFSELRRTIFREIIAKNEENRELKRIKLINLDHAYKSGDAEELAIASALTTEQHLRTITDVLTSIPQRYVGNLFYGMYWDGDEEPADVRFSTIDKWIFIPKEYGESVNHKKYIRGHLNFYKWYKRRNRKYYMMTIDIYDESFIAGIEHYLQGTMDVNRIPEYLLCINQAKQSVFRLPSGIKVKGYNALAVFCIVKEVNENNIIYYEEWNPQQRGQEIIKKLRQG